MKPAVPIAVLGLVASLGVAPGAHAADPSPATFTLPVCGQSAPVGEQYLPGCSYVALGKKGGGVYYAHLSSAGDVRMSGALSGGTLTFPATGQSWPSLALTGSPVTVTIAKTAVTGTLDGNGAMTLSLPYQATISAGVLSCKVKGTATMTSSGQDTLGGGVGRALDPATNSVALAGTSARPTTTGALCAAADQVLDLDRGLGWYVDGTLDVDAGAPVALAQTASVKLPSRIKRKGRTVLLGGPVVTTAQQQATARLTWGTKRSAKGTPPKFARVSTTGGRLVIRTKGAAKKLFVRLSLSAPASGVYGEFRSSRVWVVR